MALDLIYLVLLGLYLAIIGLCGWYSMELQ